MSAPQDSEHQFPREKPVDRDRELSEFLLRVSHDMRSPMRAIRAHAELIRRDSAASDDPRLGFIIGGIQNVELLADGLSSYALALRIEAASFQPAQMDVLTRLAMAKIRKEIQENQAQIAVDPLPTVAGNPDRLAQLMENLLLNALRHRGPDAPRIQVSAERNGNDWRFGVRDNGPGIDAAYLERIFKPFERLRGKELPGPGLGLAIAREIARKHGGTMWAESQAGAGSTFFFTLPAAA